MKATALFVMAVLLVSACGAPATSTAGTPPPSPIASATATASATPSPSVGLVAFPDVTLLAGASDGMVYRISGGQVLGSPVRACPSGTGTVLALRPAPSGQSVLVVCGGTTTGVAVLVDIPP
jgi:hypothetical protein